VTIRLLSISAALAVWVISFSVRAEDPEIVRHLGTYGGLSKKEAHSLYDNVSERIKRAAGTFSSANDPIRRSMKHALYGNQVVSSTQDAVNDANARLYLYDGLTPRTLSALFRLAPGSITACAKDYSTSEKRCEALVAAATRKRVVDVRREATKQHAYAREAAPASVVASVAVQPAATAPRAQPVSATPLVMGGARFAQPITSTPSTARPLARPVTPTGRASAAPPARMTVASNTSTTNNNTAEQYKAERAKYLESFQKKKADLEASSAATQEANNEASKASIEEQVKEAAVEASEKTSDAKQAEPGEDTGGNLDPLISDLLADPLSKSNPGKSKK
jgi:hypothetical protein